MKILIQHKADRLPHVYAYFRHYINLFLKVKHELLCWINYIFWSVKETGNQAMFAPDLSSLMSWALELA